MLWLEALHVYRGETYVLKGVDIEVGRGEVVALIGANGAGKTTTLATISGLLRARQGRIRFQQDRQGAVIDITRLGAEDIVRAGISHCPEGRQIFGNLTVRENLMIGAYLRRDTAATAKDLVEILDMFPILRERGGQSGTKLSGGEQMMLAIGRALMSRPRMLLLDEPSLGLAPRLVQQIFTIIERIRHDGTTILLVEQNAALALDIADRAYVLESGRVALTGTGRELAENEAVRKAYLGAA